MKDFRWIRYETVDDGAIAIVSLNRPNQRNAQHRGLLLELDEAFQEAERDDAVSVVILRGEGTSFSSGHDLGSKDRLAEKGTGPERNPTLDEYGGTKAGAEKVWRQEWHYFLSNTRRWRDLRKITIAAVQGQVYAGGLMLMWACDLIVADETAEFADVVATRLGICGVEYFAHPWELGPRRAKELLLTGDSMDAHTAYEIGMVSRVFPAGTLDARALEFARRIAKVPTVTALMIKEAVNQAQDNQGFHNSLQAALSIHNLNHAHWAIVNEDETKLVQADAMAWKELGPIVRRSKDQVKGEASP
jgi:enoyl-CoA hydratase